MKIKLLIIITALFFAGMLALTLTARSIHNASLPHVRAERPASAKFPFEYADENGELRTGMRYAPAVSKEQLEQGVYVLYTAEKNGEKRDFIRLAEITAGEEYEGYVEVTGGLSPIDRIVTESDRELAEGEVLIVL